MSFPQPAPQRVITISIVGIERDARVYYSYHSPIYGTVYVNAPTCDISVDQPTNTLFVLDFSATLNGWMITGTSPNNDPHPLDTLLGPQALSIMTINPCDPATPKHAYYIHYLNKVTNAEMQRDPQEGNVNPPGQTDPK